MASYVSPSGESQVLPLTVGRYGDEEEGLLLRHFPPYYFLHGFSMVILHVMSENSYRERERTGGGACFLLSILMLNH